MPVGVFSTPYGSISPANRGHMQSHAGISFGAARLPTDALFFANLTLQNVLAGSRYRVTRVSNGAELATGVATGSGNVDWVINAIPIYTNPMQVAITVRNASGTPAYKIFDTQASMGRGGATAFILQIED